MGITHVLCDAAGYVRVWGEEGGKGGTCGDTMHPDPVRNVAILYEIERVGGRYFLKPLPHVSAQEELVAMKQINSLQFAPK